MREILFTKLQTSDLRRARVRDKGRETENKKNEEGGLKPEE
jgi:hypothetical protein